MHDHPYPRNGRLCPNLTRRAPCTGAANFYTALTALARTVGSWPAGRGLFRTGPVKIRTDAQRARKNVVALPTRCCMQTSMLTQPTADLFYESARRDVVVLSWPAQTEEREGLERKGVPRLWLVEAGVDPPVGDSCIEDWLRMPAEDADVRARLASLAARAAHPVGPPLDATASCPATVPWCSCRRWNSRSRRRWSRNFGEAGGRSRPYRVGVARGRERETLAARPRVPAATPARSRSGSRSPASVASATHDAVPRPDRADRASTVRIPEGYGSRSGTRTRRPRKQSAVKLRRDERAHCAVSTIESATLRRRSLTGRRRVVR